ncbi:Protein lsb5 [Leucoagaricus sp. SymC.cos]|nr:Protein lsb5 [Leucoagaricus sp. SymC.cos]
MSKTGFNFKQAFGREKPHSSVTDWVEIMTGSQTPEESYEGMPELVDAINLQASGPTEAARALRKKMKHGGPHQQYRAIVIMRLLVDNVPAKTKLAFTDSQFLDVIKSMWGDPFIDKRVKKRLSTILLAWQEQFKGDAEMAVFAGLYGQLKRDKLLFQDEEVLHYLGHVAESAKLTKIREQREKQEVEKREREANRRSEREGGRRRRSFNFERDKVKVTSSIVNASQASSNLLNAIMRVNLDTDSFEKNEEVQDWLTKAKAAKKVIMRYTQLVENEELIGTLIETHERLEAALNTYHSLIVPEEPTVLASGVAHLSLTDQELAQIQADNDAAAQLAKNLDAANDHEPSHAEADSGKDKSDNLYDAFLHPDLADLDFNSSAHNLPPPIRPTSASANRNTGKGVEEDRRGSLSDYSDYESSDEETFISPPKKRTQLLHSMPHPQRPRLTMIHLLTHLREVIDE